MPERNYRSGICFIIAWGLVCFARTALAGDDWRQFRGPNGSGISNTRHLPVELGPERNRGWKTSLPPGYSSPVLTRDRIFVTAFEGQTLLTICLELQTGRILWRREVPRNRSDRLGKPNNPASPSPVTDGKNVYVFFQDFGLLSYAPDGRERWRLPLGPFNVQYGFGASPILVDDLAVLSCDQDTDSFLIAVEQKTGRVRWKVARPDVISGYSTPTIYQPRSGPKQIIVPESFRLSAYSVKDGQRLWWVRGLACEMKSIASLNGDTIYINGWGWPENQPGKQIAIPSFEEILAGFDTDRDGTLSKAEAPEGRLKKDAYFGTFDLDRDGKLNARDWGIYRAMMAAENGLLAIRLGGQGDMTETGILWRYQKPVPQVPSTLFYEDVLYMVNDSGILISFDPKTGQVIKQGRLKGAIDKYFASPVAADGKVYLIGQGGTMSVVRAGREWEILALNELGEEVYATPAIADGRIFIRTQGALSCFHLMHQQ